MAIIDDANESTFIESITSINIHEINIFYRVRVKFYYGSTNAKQSDEGLRNPSKYTAKYMANNDKIQQVLPFGIVQDFVMVTYP